MLHDNLAINGFTNRARVVPAALAAQSGTGVLQHTADGSWGFSLHEDASQALGSEPVELTTLADALGPDRPDIVKCNAEGAEFTFLEQLAATALRPALMVVMVHPGFGDLAALLHQATALGYRVERFGTPERPAFQMWHTGTVG
jgi:FkbM family methyltransferase